MFFNRSLSATEITALYQNQSVGIDDTLVSDASLVSYLRFNETRGKTAYDSKGLNNGNLTGYDLSQPFWSSNGGYDGSGAYVFDGVDDNILLTLPSFSTYTATAWVKNSTAGSWSHIAWSWSRCS
jgi:hypothetical protein